MKRILFQTFYFIFVFAFLLSLSCALFNSTVVNSNNHRKSDDVFCVDEERIDQNRALPTITEHPFQGQSMTIEVGDFVYSSFSTNNRTRYFKYHSLAQGYRRMNYSGPTASITIYYSNFFSSTDYLTYEWDVNSAIDCYYFDYNAEYIIELSSAFILGFTTFSFSLSNVTSNTSNIDNYILHQTMDSSSQLGFHYNVEFFDFENITYTPMSSTIISNSYSCSYYDVIDDHTYFYDLSKWVVDDDRRIVSDTKYLEYNSVAKVYAPHAYFNPTSGLHNGIGGGSGGTATFISETALLSCAHMFHSEYKQVVDNTEQILSTSLQSIVSFYPGVNYYSGFDESYYGTYSAKEIYIPVKYIVSDKVSNDWAFIVSEQLEQGIYNHSAMAPQVLGDNYNSSNKFNYSLSAGYPGGLHKLINDSHIYQNTLWIGYPLNGKSWNSYDNDNNRIIISTDHVVSSGNSGGPLYTFSSYFENGHINYSVSILGICHGINFTENHETNKNIYNFTMFAPVTYNLLKLIEGVLYEN